MSHAGLSAMFKVPLPGKLLSLCRPTAPALAGLRRDSLWSRSGRPWVVRRHPMPGNPSPEIVWREEGPATDLDDRRAAIFIDEVGERLSTHGEHLSGGGVIKEKNGLVGRSRH